MNMDSCQKKSKYKRHTHTFIPAEIDNDDSSDPNIVLKNTKVEDPHNVEITDKLLQPLIDMVKGIKSDLTRSILTIVSIIVSVLSIFFMLLINSFDYLLNTLKWTFMGKLRFITKIPIEVLAIICFLLIGIQTEYDGTSKYFLFPILGIVLIYCGYSCANTYRMWLMITSGIIILLYGLITSKIMFKLLKSSLFAIFDWTSIVVIILLLISFFLSIDLSKNNENSMMTSKAMNNSIMNARGGELLLNDAMGMQGSMRPMGMGYQQKLVDT